jgi:hypothetical protein|tara:strand:- start:11115 stop:11807 length:693 start_codon:yes stop_codon:yes gene_type:complete
MANIRKYLADARANANENFSNASGGFVDDANFSGDDFFSANGGGVSAPTSQPYIIEVTSTSGSAVNNFAVLGSYEFINNAGFTAGGDLVIGSITISSGISGVNYREMLYQFMQNPYSVGLTYLQSATANQVLETLAVNTRDANGNEAQKTLVPTIDPYQQQSNIIAMRYGYRIDGFTKIKISSVLANATIKLYFYPSDNINLARGLAGRPVSEAFGNPGIVKAQTIKLQG